MKKIINKIILVALVFSAISSCKDPDNAIYDVFDDTTQGAILRTLDYVSVNFNLFDPSSTFEVVIEEQDVENGALLSKVDVYVSFEDNKDDGTDYSKPEILVTSFDASEFTKSANGLPSTSIFTTLSETLAALKLADGEYNGGDLFYFRLELVLTDGRTFSSDDSSAALSGSYFSSPYEYKVGMLCIPESPFTGDYVIKMQDSYGDGWQGSKITVEIDGENTDVFLLDYWSSSEPYGPIYYDWQETVTVPEGTSTLIFSFTAGDYPSEVTFQIYSPSGNLIADVGPGPIEGEIALNLCDE
ncbi:hypothetical protein [Lutibacter sp. B1]|uniref:hypothetical protein n=1 Tax=Lutibacter sp. B1 TaxID=2725996 RepID=UPI0014565D2F|nr:hypothetical protein [Lutibacter sp. B1]NLP58774.1 hypothetical protein [Lutibacter sp. B1]